MKKLLKIFAIIAVVLIVCFMWVVDEAKRQRYAKRDLEKMFVEKSQEISQEIFGKSLPPIEYVKIIGAGRHFVLSPEHLDAPVKLRKFSEALCGIQDLSHCYLIFYTSRTGVPISAHDDGDRPNAFFTINKTTNYNDLGYNLEDAGYGDQKGDLQKYFAGHNKPWQ